VVALRLCYSRTLEAVAITLCINLRFRLTFTLLTYAACNNLLPVASLLALGLWAPPAEWGPSLESIYWVFLTVDLCKSNKIISFKKFISSLRVGGPSKRKNLGPWARAQCAHWLRRPCLLQIAGVTTMKLVLRHRECDTDKLARLLLNAGYRLRSDDDTHPPPCRNRLRSVPETPGDSGLLSAASSVFRDHRQTVVTLTHLCRLRLRHSVAVGCRGRCFADSLRRLPLPTLLRDFVAFAGEFALDVH